MFIVTIENDGVVTEIHGRREKLTSGKVVKGINAIDTFSFSLLPSNPGFNAIRDFTTLIKVYNTNQDRYEFYGRVLYSDTTMEESGLITKDVTCESYFGYLCDSQQTYSVEKNWTVNGLFKHIIDAHNAQVEEYKRFIIGEVTVTDPNDNLYCGIQRENTWDTLKEKLLDKLGGEFRFRVEDGVNYIDYLTEIGKTSETEIAVSRNMKSIKQEKDPSAYVTRLIPLGMKMGENDERLEITSVNNGKNYIDDEDGIALYGIHVAYQEWDDVTEASNLLTKGQTWLKENNKLQIKYSITALDLSLLGLDIDDFEVHNYYPIKNPLLGIDDVARLIKKSIDICEEVKSTIEIGENFKTMSDIQVSQAEEAAKIYSKITKTDEEIKLEVKNEIKQIESNLTQKVDSISLSVTNGKDSSTIALTVDGVEVSSQTIKFEGEVVFASDLTDGETSISGDNVNTGTVKASHIKLGGEMNIYEDVDSDTLAGKIGFFTASVNGDEDEVLGLYSANGIYMAGEGKGYFVANDNITVATNGNILYNCGSNSGHMFYGYIMAFNGSAIHAQTSDRRLKSDIDYEQSDKMIALFDKLTPATFHMTNFRPDDLHVGFIAQDIAEAATEVGLAGALATTDCNGMYGLNYGEITAVLTAKIKQLEKEIQSWKS